MCVYFVTCSANAKYSTKILFSLGDKLLFFKSRTSVSYMIAKNLQSLVSEKDKDWRLETAWLTDFTLGAILSTP